MANEAGRVAAQPGSRITVDLRFPDKWTYRHFWAWKGQRAFGAVFAFCPRSLLLGVELITGSCWGVAFVIGPLWIGFATIKLSRDSDASSTEDRESGLSGEAVAARAEGIAQ